MRCSPCVTARRCTQVWRGRHAQLELSDSGRVDSAGARFGLLHRVIHILGHGGATPGGRPFQNNHVILMSCARQ